MLQQYQNLLRKVPVINWGNFKHTLKDVFIWYLFGAASFQGQLQLVAVTPFSGYLTGGVAVKVCISYPMEGVIEFQLHLRNFTVSRKLSRFGKVLPAWSRQHN